MTTFIPPEKISEIQSSLNIVDIISDYVKLKKTGKNFLGLCPFHHEKTPSFTVNEQKQIYKCFGCGEGGTVFNFLMKQEALTFTEAVNMLADKTNIKIDISSQKENRNEINNLYKLNEKATCFFSDMLLKTQDGKRSRNYVSDRSINNDSIRKFRLGYSPNSWNSIVNKSNEWGTCTQELEKAGLVLRKQEKCYDRFRNRLMFPIFDFQSRPVGFGARSLDSALPKYLNSPETPIFSKSKTLYGINLAREAIISNRKVLIMEGYTDVIIAHQYGVDWSIAVLGTALTREHIKLLRRYCDKAILVFDADTAGQTSSERNLDIFIEEDFDVNIALLPNDYDPYDFITKNGKQLFLEQVDKAYDFFGFKIKLLETKWDMSSVSGKSSAIDSILSTAMKIPDIIKRDLTIKRIAEEMSVDEQLLRNHLARFKDLKCDHTNTGKIHNRISGNLKNSMSADHQVEMTILGLMINRNDLIKKVNTEIGFDNFKDNEIRNIVERISEIYSKKGKVELGDIFPMLDSTEISKRIVDTITKQEFMKKSIVLGLADAGEKVFKDCIQYIKKRDSRKSLEQARKKILHLNKTKGNQQEVDQLLDGFHEKNKNFHSLKRSV